MLGDKTIKVEGSKSETPKNKSVLEIEKEIVIAKAAVYDLLVELEKYKANSTKLGELLNQYNEQIQKLYKRKAEIEKSEENASV